MKKMELFALEIDKTLFFNEPVYYMKMPEIWRNFFNKERTERYKLAYKVKPLGKKLKSIFPEIISVCSNNKMLLEDQPWLVSTKLIPEAYIKKFTLGWLAHLLGYSVTELPEEIRNADPTWVSSSFGDLQETIDSYQWVPGMAAVMFCRDPKFLELGNEIREELKFHHVIFNDKHECISKPLRHSERQDPFSYVIRFELKTRGGDAGTLILTVSLGTRRYISKAKIKDGKCYMRSGHSCSVLVSVQNPYTIGTDKSFSQLKFKKKSKDGTSFTSWDNALDGLFWDVLNGEAFDSDLLLSNPQLYSEGAAEITAYIVNNNLFVGNSVKAGIGLSEKRALFNLVRGFLKGHGAQDLKLIPEVSQRGMNDSRFPMFSEKKQVVTFEIMGSLEMYNKVIEVLTTPQKSIEHVTILEKISESQYRLYCDKEVIIDIIHCNSDGIVAELELDKYRDIKVAYDKRVNQIAKCVSKVESKPVLTLVEIDEKEKWREGTDPKNAIREGMKRAGRLTQFIYPLQDDENGDLSRIINGTLDLLNDYGIYSDNVKKLRLPGTLMSITVLKAGNKYLPAISKLEGTDLRVKMFGFDSWMSIYEAALNMDNSTLLDNPNRNNRSSEVFKSFITAELQNQLDQGEGQLIVLINAKLRYNWLSSIGNTQIQMEDVPKLNERLSNEEKLRFIRINATEDVPQYRIIINDDIDRNNKASGIYKDPIGVYYGVGGRPSAWKGILNEATKFTSPSKLLLQQRAVEYIPLGAKDEGERDQLAVLVDHLRRLGLTYDKHTILPYTMRVLDSLSKYITGNEEGFDYDAEFDEEVVVEIMDDLSLQMEVY